MGQMTERKKGETMKGVLRTILLLLGAIAVALGIRYLHSGFRKTEAAAPSSAEILVRQDEDGVLRCYRNGLPCSVSGIVRDREAGCWRYAADGVIDGDYCGFAEENGLWWLVDHGTVDFDRNEVVEGVVDGREGLWYVSGGTVMTDYSGVTEYTDSGTMRVVECGRADLSFTGFASNSRGWWYAENGAVDTEKTALIEGTLAGEDALWYVADGQVQLSFSGLADVDGDGAPWYILYGRAAPDLTGVVQLGEDHWYCRSGRVERRGREAIVEDGVEWIVTDGSAVRADTEEQKTYFRALQVVARITDESMTKEEKLRVCFEYMKTDYWECVPRTPNLAEPGWHVIYANDLFVGDGGNCFSFAAAFAFLAKACGYDEVYCCNSVNHGWAEIDGLIYDPEWSRHSDGFDIYGLSYDSVTGEGYAAGLFGADRPGMEWMRVPI